MTNSSEVKDYQGKREYLVLSLVRKYPVYSLDRLLGELPGISRHSIQIILEKNNLSTVAQRLAFTKKSSFNFSLSFKPLNRLKNFLSILGQWRHWSFKGSLYFWGTLLVLAVLLVAFWQAVVFASAKTPVIALNQPVPEFENHGAKLYVEGQVKPVGSQVKVNGNQVSVAGDGNFTAVVEIPLGESVLGVDASYRGKQMSFVRLVTRLMTDEEQSKQQEEAEAKRQEGLDWVASTEKNVNDLLAAKNASSGQQQNILRVLNSHLQEISGFTNVVGEVMNMGQSELSWVMITVSFFDEQGNLVDTKYGFATDFNQVIKPGQTAKFETQATNRAFNHYSLGLSWQEAAVAGVATGGGASSSGEIHETTKKISE